MKSSIYRSLLIKSLLHMYAPVILERYRTTQRIGMSLRTIYDLGLTLVKTGYLPIVVTPNQITPRACSVKQISQSLNRGRTAFLTRECSSVVLPPISWPV